MTLNHVSHVEELQLVLHYYGEADAPDAIESHLATCDSCREAFKSLQSTLNALPEPEIPWRSETYGEDVWRKLVRSADLQISRSADRVWWRPRFALAAAALALPLVGFLVGLTWSRTAPAPTSSVRTTMPTDTVSDEVLERLLLANVGDHLERSQMALVELVNTDAERPVDISTEQTWVEDLLAANRLYRQSALEDGKTAVADLLDELERVLVEIARGPSTMNADDMARLRSRIEERGLLFKVRVLGSRIREDAQRPLAPTS